MRARRWADTLGDLWRDTGCRHGGEPVLELLDGTGVCFVRSHAVRVWGPLRPYYGPAALDFLLGSHQPAWLEAAAVPLFISDTRLQDRMTLPKASGRWALDSGGFTMIQRFGHWTGTAQGYVDRVRRYHDEIGHLAWCAPRDWMCEPEAIHGGQIGPLTFVGTGLSVEEHQRRTVASVLELRELAPELPWIPVVQGYTPAEYEHCVGLYDRAGIDLTREPLVALGSVCRRQGTAEAHRIIRALRAHGIHRLHGFGVKTTGLLRYGHLLSSADSLSWSDRARHEDHPICGEIHPRGGQRCNNCLPWALDWRNRLLTRLACRPRQTDLVEALECAS
ncbi:hypothetical protein M8C13_04380 [Crossiella sp. SN42]|uniref:deazapurine DNA modification protein DpdA family protein n=1 Tax=Crossiella sp. SN42 TaxID=2944808 RepID=UPI00207C1CC1|nr:hypothetical protein [Crossiella sp. SN42]MCO1574995.1 hypothetical protein [Crossiella sp. SN42]